MAIDGVGGARGSLFSTPIPGEVVSRDRPAKDYDGYLLGAGDRAYLPGTPLSAIAPFRPQNGKVPDHTLVFVNGAFDPLCDKILAFRLQQVADQTGQNVIGLHNATESQVRDLTQAVGDMFDRGQNPAVDTLTDLVCEKLRAGQRLHLVGHSQGTIITRRALDRAIARLRSEGLPNSEIEQRLSNLLVETLAGAASRWPDGPSYVHYVNHADPVPMTVGVGRRIGVHPGRGASVRSFTVFALPPGQHETSTYFRFYQPVPFDRR